MHGMADELAVLRGCGYQKAMEAVMGWNIGYDIVQKQKDDRISKKARFSDNVDIAEHNEPASCSHTLSSCRKAGYGAHHRRASAG